MSTSWIPGGSMKWRPVLDAFVASKQPVALGVMSVDRAPRGAIQATPFAGFYEIAQQVFATHKESGEIISTTMTTLMFHCDDVGWLSPIPTDFVDELSRRDPERASALTEEERRELGLDE